MKGRLSAKLDDMRHRYASVEAKLADPEVVADSARLTPLAQDHARLAPFARMHAELAALQLAP